MSQTSAPYTRTFEQAILTDTALAIPSDIDPLEVWIYSTAAVTAKGAVASDPAVPLAAATTWVRLPINIASVLRLTNSAIISVLVFGNKR